MTTLLSRLAGLQNRREHLLMSILKRRVPCRFHLYTTLLLFSFTHSPSLRFWHVNFLTQVSFLHLYRNYYTWPWPIFMISRIQLHVFHLKWKKCNYIHCSFRTKLRLRTNFRIVLSTYLHNLLGRFQASCSPEAVVPKDFTAPRVYHRCAQ